jgi:hypothetical protein
MLKEGRKEVEHRKLEVLGWLLDNPHKVEMSKAQKEGEL